MGVEMHQHPKPLPCILSCLLQTVGIAAFSDLDDVPYYLCAVMCGLYHVLGQPLESSFHQQLKTARAIGGGGAAAGPPKEAVVQVSICMQQLGLWLCSVMCECCCMPLSIE